jgi:hypothetical protein
MSLAEIAAIEREQAEPPARLTAVEAAVTSFCQGFDPAVLSPTQAADAVDRLAVIERRVAAAKARAARRVESSSMWKHAGHRTAATWMAARTGDPVAATAGLLETARKLEACAATAEAFASGAVSAHAAREIAAAVAADPRAEANLLAVAAEGDHQRLVDAAATVRRAARSAEDEAARHARLRARRFVRTRTDADGLVILNAGFTPKDWAPFAARLQRATDLEFTRARQEGRRERVEAYAADALLTMLDPEQGHSGQRTKPQPTKPQVTVLVDGLALKRGHVGPGQRCEIVGVGPVDVAWVNDLLPEAIVHVLVHDGVDITTYASATRHIPRPVQIALAARDRYCVVRGCRCLRRTERDHRTSFAEGGAGSLHNLNLLCSFHHDQKSHSGARLQRAGTEWLWWPPGATETWRSPVGSHLTLWDTDTT